MPTVSSFNTRERVARQQIGGDVRVEESPGE